MSVKNMTVTSWGRQALALESETWVPIPTWIVTLSEIGHLTLALGCIICKMGTVSFSLGGVSVELRNNICERGTVGASVG